MSDRITIGLDPEGEVNLTLVMSKLQKKLAAAEKQVASYQTKMLVPHYEQKVRRDWNVFHLWKQTMLV